jgi:hypothetical protein
MIEDPVVAEVHKTRERLIAEYGSVEALAEQWRSIENEFKHRVVRLESRPPLLVERKIS